MKASERFSTVLLRRACVAACIAGVLACAVPNCCCAQGILKTEKANINRILRGGKLAGADRQLFSQYFSAFFGQFLDSKAGPATFHDVRKDLEIFLRTGKTGDAYNQLVNMANLGLQSVAKSPKFAPAVRLNAVLVLGSLKDKEPNGNPLPAAYLFLTSVVSGPAEKYPDQLKVAAMIGLERYAESGILPPRYKDPLTTAMLEIFEREVPPDNRTAEGHTWMRCEAAKVLGALGSPGPNDNVVAAMEKVIADPGAKASFRCEVAECLGKLQYPKDAKIDYQALANLLGHQAVEVCQGEIEAASESGREPSRGMIVYGLYSALHGLEGPTGRSGLVAASNGTPGQAFISDLRKKIKDAYDLTQDEDEVADTELTAKVQELVADLQSVLLPKPQPKQDTVATADAATADGAAPAADAAAAAEPAAN